MDKFLLIETSQLCLPPYWIIHVLYSVKKVFKLKYNLLNSVLKIMKYSALIYGI